MDKFGHQQQQRRRLKKEDLGVLFGSLVRCYGYQAEGGWCVAQGKQKDVFDAYFFIVTLPSKYVAAAAVQVKFEPFSWCDYCESKLS